MSETPDVPVEVSGIAESLLLPVCSRGMEAGRPHGQIHDPIAARPRFAKAQPAA